MKEIRHLKLFLCLLLMLMNVLTGFAFQSPVNVTRPLADTAAKATAPAPQTSANRATANEAARQWWRKLPVLPSLVRGNDGLLNPFGQRATQSTYVSSTNVKDPVTDTFVLTGGLPVEAAEAVRIPPDQFSVALPKFYATVPAFDPVNAKAWHLSVGSPFFAVKNSATGVQGLRSAAPSLFVTGALFGGKLMLAESLEQRFSKTTIETLEDGPQDSAYRAFDWHNRADLNLWKEHTTSARFAFFTQKADAATLNALVEPEATPEYFMIGGQASFSDTYLAKSGFAIDSSVSFKQLRLRLLPRGNEPMKVVEQGEVSGNYFDRLRRDASRFEWREVVRLPTRNGWGTHHLTLSGGLARAAYEATHVGNKIIFSGHDDDELFSVTTFTGSPFEAQAAEELSGAISDEWSPARRLSLTLGMKYDWTTLSRKHQWSPRFGFAWLPFQHERTIVRGGAGIFYDILPLTVGVFPRSRQRVIQFFDEGEALGEPRTIANRVTHPYLRTPHLVGWNLEVNQQLTRKLLLRVKGEERRGRNQLLLTPDRPGTQVTAFVLSNSGASRSRELETTLRFAPNDNATVNVSYVRAAGFADSNSFIAQIGTFEKSNITRNQYAQLRTDAPHRVLCWGNLQTPGGFSVMPSLDVHTGFPYAFTDADNNVPAIQDFGRLPRFVSFDLGLYKDLPLKAFDQKAKFRIGVTAYNLTNHFNPRQALTGEEEEGEAKQPITIGFLDSVRRTYRAHLTFSF